MCPPSTNVPSQALYTNPASLFPSFITSFFNLFFDLHLQTIADPSKFTLKQPLVISPSIQQLLLHSPQMIIFFPLLSQLHPSNPYFSRSILYSSLILEPFLNPRFTFSTHLASFPFPLFLSNLSFPSNPQFPIAQLCLLEYSFCKYLSCTSILDFHPYPPPPLTLKYILPVFFDSK